MDKRSFTFYRCLCQEFPPPFVTLSAQNDKVGDLQRYIKRFAGLAMPLATTLWYRISHTL
jgi:hypothetical protein